MGSNNSKPAPPLNEKLLAERLRALQLKDEADNEFVHVNEKDAQASREFQTPWASLCTSDIKQWEDELLDDPKNRLAMAALTQNSPNTVLTSQRILVKDLQVFSVTIPFEGAPITNQHSSGRCWLFASTNVFRIALMKRHNLENFQLSQSYLFFWDKLEKANWFLEQILDTTEEPVEGRLMQKLLEGPVMDGGQWDMVWNLVHKYGLVPQVLYPDSFNAMYSATLDQIVTTKLREDALVLRDMVEKGKGTKEILVVKARMMREIHLILTLTLGPPPDPTAGFTWTYLDRSGHAQKLTTTPLAFAHELDTPRSMSITKSRVHSMFSLVHDPRNEYYQRMSVSRLGNVVGGREITYVNVPMPILKQACVDMLKAGLPVFFGSDVGKFSNREKGIMDTKVIDYELGFNIRLGMDKRQRLLTGESQMTHAMVLTGVHLREGDKGEIVRWRVQNSWGPEVGEHGWFVMSDAWMSEFVYQAVVEPGFVEKRVTDVLKEEKLMLELWDPMGALA